MYTIKLKIGGIDKEFTKEYINVEDNLLATEQNWCKIYACLHR